MKPRNLVPVLALLLALLLPAAAHAAWTEVPPAFTGNEAAGLSYNDQGTLTELDLDAGLPGSVWHGRSRPAGGSFGGDFELPFLLPLSAVRPDGTEALVGMDSSHDVKTALRANAATSFAVTDEHSTSQTFPPAGISVSSSGAGLAEWIDSAGHVQVAELSSTGSAFGAAAAVLPSNPVQQVTFLSVVAPVLDPSGSAVLTWAASSDGSHYQLEQSTRASAGGSFGAATAVGPSIEVEPQVVSNRSGVAAAAWWNPDSGHVEVAVRQPGGSFGATQVIGTPDDTFDLDSLQAKVMGDGTVVVLWRDYKDGPAGICEDGGTGTTLHVDTLKPGGAWQSASTGSTETRLGTGYQGPVLAVSQSTFSLATPLGEGQGTAECGESPKRIYAWQGAPGSFDGQDWTLLPGQTTSDDSVSPVIAADSQGDTTVSWSTAGTRQEATTGPTEGTGGGGETETGGGNGGNGGPEQFGPPAPKNTPAPAPTTGTEAVGVRTVTVVAFNVGLGRPETVELPISCTASVACNVMAEAAIRLAWGNLSARPLAARASGRTKPKAKTASLPLPKVQLQLAPHAQGKLAIKVPKATVKRLESLLRTKGAKATLTVKLRVNGVPQRQEIQTKLHIKQVKPAG